MGGCHHPGALTAQFFNDAHRQCRAFRRVGTGAQLIQKHQRTLPRLLKDACDLLHVAGKRRQALLNALLIANVHQIFLEHAHRAALVGRNQEAALGHGAQKPRRF